MTRANEKIERFVIRGYDTGDVRLGVNWLVRYACDHGLRHATLYTHDRGSVENLREATGATLASRLQRHHSVVMNGIAVQSATRRDYPRALAPVLAVWAKDDELIDRLDSANVPALCAIPWSDQLENWIGKWGPVDLATGKPVSGLEATITNRTVRRALRSVTTMANLSNGYDSRNRGLVGHAFLVLRDSDEAIDADEVEAWMAQNGWGAKNAQEARTDLLRVLKGRGLRFGANPYAADVLDFWRSEEAD